MLKSSQLRTALTRRLRPVVERCTSIAKVKRVRIPYKPDKSRKSCVYNCDDLLPYTICFISLLKLHIADDQVRAFVEELAVYLEGHLVELDAVSKTN